VYHRETAAQHIVVALNFTGEPRAIDLPGGKILLSTIDDRVVGSTESPLTLAPDEGVIIMLEA
ncbi:MAG: hypothetical protein WA571_14100, partial [Candidatus Binatus sp.]